LRGEDAVRATVRKMSNQEADDVACSVVRLFGRPAREETRWQRPRSWTPAHKRLRRRSGQAAQRVPQWISLYGAGAQGLQSSFELDRSQRVVSS